MREKPELKELKEGAPSFEEFAQKVKEAMGLMRTRDLLSPYNSLYGDRRGGPIRKIGGYQGDPDYYEANLDAVKEYSAFKKLIENEQTILAGGASPQEVAKYSTIAEQAYKLKEGVLKPIEEELEALQRDYYGPGEFIYKAAEILHRVSPDGKTWDTDLEDSLLRDKFANLQSSLERTEERERNEKERVKLQEVFGGRYRERLKDAQAALNGQRMLAELKVMGEMARVRGFVGPEEMWFHDLEELQKLKEEVGEDGFKQLESMNRAR